MALHTTGVVSRHNLAHPDEKPAPSKPAYEQVLKYNPNHDSAGRFSSGGGGRRGGSDGTPREDAFGKPLPRRLRQRGSGTMGPPTEDAFGNPLRSRRGGPAGGQFASPKTGVSAHSQEAQYAKSHVHGTPDGGSGTIESGGLRSRGVYVPGVTNAFGERLSDVEGKGGSAERAAAARAADGPYSASKFKFHVEGPAGQTWRFDKAADAIKAHNDAVDKDKTTGNQDAAYDAIMAARRRKSKKR